MWDKLQLYLCNCVLFFNPQYDLFWNLCFCAAAQLLWARCRARPSGCYSEVFLRTLMKRSETRSQWVKDLLYKLWPPEGNVEEKTRQGWLESAWRNSGEQTSQKHSRTALEVFAGANKDTGISAKAKKYSEYQENTKEWHCVVTIQDVIIWRRSSGETRVI